MKDVKRPYNAETLLKWKAFRVTKNVWAEKPYTEVLVPLTSLTKEPEYQWLKPKLNKLYKDYTKAGYDVVWKELQDFNEARKERFIQEDILLRSEYSAKFQMEELIAYFGEIPKCIQDLKPEKHALLLDRARLLYEVEPDYEICKLHLKDIYVVPERELMDVREGYDEDIPIYHKIKPAELTQPHRYNTIVGKAEVVSEYARKLAEQAAIRDAAWIAKYCPEFKVADTIEELLCPEED
jgi:hypothetical protein